MEAQDWDLFPSPWSDFAAEPPASTSPAQLRPFVPHHDDPTPHNLNGSRPPINNYDRDSQSWQGFDFDFSVDLESMHWEPLQEQGFLDGGEQGAAAPEAFGALSSTDLPPTQPTSSEPLTRPARARVSRKPKIRKENWAAHKEKIRTLYIDEDKKLEDVMEIMKEEHDFDASAPMYKEKFQEWEFFKYIPRGIVGKLLRIADERKPKSTEFVHGGRIWTSEEIKKKDEKRRPQNEAQGTAGSPVLPRGLVVRTPRMISPVLQNAITRQATPGILPSTASAILRRGSGDVMGSPTIQFRLDATSGPPRRWGPGFPSPRSTHGRPWSPAVQGHFSNSPGPRSLFFTPERRNSSQGFLPPPSRSHTPKVSEHPWRTPLPPVTELLHSLVSKGDTNISGLHIMRQHALSLINEGKFDEGIAKLRATLSRFQELLSPTHDFTLEVAYNLARLLGLHNSMDEANSILDWLGLSLVKKHGMHNEKTIAHYIKVVSLLRLWSRDEDAELLIYKIADVWEDDEDETSTPTIPGAIPSLSALVTLPDADIKRLFYEPDCEHAAEVQLRLAEILLSSNKIHLELATDLEDVSRKLVDYCEREGLLAQTIRATLCLSKIYRATVTRERALEAVDVLIPKLQDFWLGFESPSQNLLKSSTDLAFFYHSIESPSQCCDVLELTADGLESRSLRFETEQKALINFYISVVMEWQKHGSKPDAELWVQRALANSMQLLGKHHPKTRVLEKTLESESYLWTASDLLVFEIDETVNGRLRV